MSDHPHLTRPLGRPRRALVGLAGAAVLAGAAAGCVPRVPVDPGDATAPDEVRWTVFDAGTPVGITGNGTYTIHRGEEITVWFHAKDDDGLQRISLSASTGWSCAGGGLGQQVGPGLAVPDVVDLVPDASGTVPVSSVLATNVGPGPYRCGTGMSFVGGTTSLVGQARSWGGGTATATLTVTIQP